jgi:two-component system, NtrC family, response regulator PilR
MASFEAIPVLVVDDEPDLRALYELTLVRSGYNVTTAGCLDDARAALAQRRFEVVITDMRLPDGSGQELLREHQAANRTERCIVITAYGSANNAVEALKLGAFDYLTKPVDLRQLRQVVANAASQALKPIVKPQATAASGLSNDRGGASWPSVPTSTSASPVPVEALFAASPQHPGLVFLVGHSSPIQRLRETIQKVARTMAPVHIRGESGTGKELVARALHACSPRSAGPFVAVNCGAIPENLLEAEFFGARKGAYTGATADRTGYFDAASGGTLFLDEIGDLPIAMQAKLLRAIQERTIRALGTTEEQPVNVRLVSATHKDLSDETKAGRFRQDLLYRLNVIELRVPALRERREDLPLLCRTLGERIARDNGIDPPVWGEAFLASLQHLPFDGNVRELENMLHRALAMGLEQEPVGPTEPNSTPFAAVPSHASSSATGATPPDELPRDLQAHLDDLERSILERALHELDFNRTKAAHRLGMSLRQMRYRIDRLGIAMPTEMAETRPSDECP